MILLDTNIIIYAAGVPHPHKDASATLIDRVARGMVDAALDAEVLQEILHRYRKIERWRDGRLVYDLARRVVPRVVPITAEVVDEAWLLLEAYSRLSARDALHAAVCRRTGAEAICTYDSDFDQVEGLKRVEPRQLL